MGNYLTTVQDYLVPPPPAPKGVSSQSYFNKDGSEIKPGQKPVTTNGRKPRRPKNIRKQVQGGKIVIGKPIEETFRVIIYIYIYLHS